MREERLKGGARNEWRGILKLKLLGWWIGDLAVKVWWRGGVTWSAVAEIVGIFVGESGTSFWFGGCLRDKILESFFHSVSDNRAEGAL